MHTARAKPPPSPMPVPPPAESSTISHAREDIAPTASELVSTFRQSLLARTEAVASQLQLPSGRSEDECSHNPGSTDTNTLPTQNGIADPNLAGGSSSEGGGGGGSGR